jgi:predicted N-formylglutamate amidohydrolase
MNDPVPPLSPVSPPSPVSRLLDLEDPPPFTVINPDGRFPLVLVCDHASNAVPAALKQLGLGQGELARHIAWDIGAAGVTRRLAARLDAPAVLCGYSRLVIDCNRPPWRSHFDRRAQ